MTTRTVLDSEVNDVQWFQNSVTHYSLKLSNACHSDKPEFHIKTELTFIPSLGKLEEFCWMPSTHKESTVEAELWVEHYWI